jgi:hypothetical protein
VVEHFAKEKEEAKSKATKKNIKSNQEITECKNEIFVRYIDVIAGEPRHICRVFCHPIRHSRFNGKGDIFV